MHHTQGGIAIPYLLYGDAYTAHIVDLSKAHSLAAHLVVDGVDVLGPPADLGLDSGLGQLFHQEADNPLEIAGWPALRRPGPRSRGIAPAPDSAG